MHTNTQLPNKGKQILKISQWIRQEMLHEFRSNTDHSLQAGIVLVLWCKETLANFTQNRNTVKEQLPGLKKELNNRPPEGQELG